MMRDASAAAALAAFAVLTASPNMIGVLPSAASAIVPPLQTFSSTCTEGTRAEISDDLELNPCLLLPRRIVWRGKPMQSPPLVIKQTLERERFGGSQSTGSAVWSGGLALVREMERQGADYWRGKRVVELGSGTGLASIAAAKLGAASAIATDGDAAVLELATANANANLDKAERAAFSARQLRWGSPVSDAALLGADVVLAADVTYSRDAWPLLAQTMRSLGAPVLLSASERRPGEIEALRDYLAAAGLKSALVDSPMAVGYAAEKVKLMWLERPGSEQCTFWTEEESFAAVEPVLGVRCQKPLVKIR